MTDFVRQQLEKRLRAYDREGFFGKWHLDGSPEEAWLGTGSSGCVYAVSSGTEHAAIKIVPIDGGAAPHDAREREALQQKLNKKLKEVQMEISISEKLKGAPNVAYFHGSEIIKRTDTDMDCWDVLIWMNKLTPLEQRFKNIARNSSAYRMEAMRIWNDIGNALKACERRSIIHADVKPDNILFCEEDDYYMLCDFGVAIQSARFTKEWQGTFPYMSPEMFYQQGGDNRADMYSLAVVIYGMFNGDIIPQQFVKLNEKKKGNMLSQPVQPIKGIRKDVNDVLLRCLAADPNERYANMAEVEEVTARLLSKYKQKGDVTAPAFQGKKLIPIAAGASAALLLVILLAHGIGRGREPASDGPNAAVTETAEGSTPGPVAGPTMEPTPEPTPEPSPKPEEEPTAVPAMAGATVKPKETPVPTETPSPTSESTPVPVMHLTLDEETVASGTGEVTIHGSVTVDGELDAAGLRVSVNGTGTGTQWEATEDGYEFTTSLDMDLEGVEALEVAVVSTDSADVQPVSMVLPVTTPEPSPEPTAEALEPLVLEELDQLDGRWIGMDGVLSLSGMAQPGKAVDVTVNGVVLGSYAVEEDGVFAADILPVSMMEGDNTITVGYAQSAQTNGEDRISFLVHYDATAPEIDAQPAIDQYTQQFAVTVRDMDSACKVGLSVDGQVVTEMTAQDGGVLFSGVDTLGLTEQSVILITASDSAGNRSEHPVVFSWLRAAVLVDGMEEMSGRIYNTAPTITGTADPNAELEVMYGALAVTVTADAEGRYSCTLDGDALMEGENSVSVRYVGDEQSAVSFVIRMDITEPAVTLSAEKVLPGDLVRISVSGEGRPCTLAVRALGAENAQSDVEGVPIAAGEEYTFTVAADAVRDQSGYSVTVVDQAGNTATRYISFLQPIAVSNAGTLSERAWGAGDRLELQVQAESGMSVTVLANGVTAAASVQPDQSGTLTLNGGELQNGENVIRVVYADERLSAAALEQTAAEFTVYVDTQQPEAQVEPTLLTRDTESITVSVSNEPFGFYAALLIDGTVALEKESAEDQLVITGLRELDMRDVGTIELLVSDSVNEPIRIGLSYENTSEMVESYALPLAEELGSISPGEDLSFRTWVICDSYDMTQGYITMRLSDGVNTVECPIYSQWREEIQDETTYDELVADLAADGVKIDQSYTNSVYLITGMTVPENCQGGRQTLEMVCRSDNGTNVWPLGTVEVTSAQSSQSVQAFVNEAANYAIGFDEPVQSAFRADSVVLTGWIYSEREPSFTSYVVSNAGGSFTGNLTYVDYEWINADYARSDAADYARELGLAGDGQPEACRGFVMYLDLQSHPENNLLMVDGVYTIQLYASNETSAAWPAAQAVIQLSGSASPVSEAEIADITASWAPAQEEQVAVEAAAATVDQASWSSP